MRFLIGIDDTDNLESRGTGFRGRMLGSSLAEARIGELRGASRHQLLVHDDIPYTSHNSSLCLDIRVNESRAAELAPFCRDFLLRESATGSDAGLCIAAWDSVPDNVTEFGQSAQTTVLTLEDATQLALEEGLLLEGLTGDHGGMIGALSAVGLRRGGNDGRFVWLKGIREVSGVMSTADLLTQTGIDVIRTMGGEAAAMDARIRTSDWTRAVLIDGQAVLLVEKPEDGNVDYDWKIVAREVIRRY